MVSLLGPTCPKTWNKPSQEFIAGLTTGSAFPSMGTVAGSSSPTNAVNIVSWRTECTLHYLERA